MQEGKNGAATERAGESANSRPQRGGEAATTRFGMEASEAEEPNATGGPSADEEDRDDSKGGGEGA